MRFKSGDEFVSNLVSEYCPEPSISSTIRLETYYKKAHSMFHQALDFVKQGNDARSYIELMRFAQFIMQLTNHNSYSMKQYEKEKNLNKKRLTNAITKMEELRPKLVKAYNDEIKKDKERKEKEKQQPKQPIKTEDIESPSPSPSPLQPKQQQQQKEKEEEEEKKGSQKDPNRWKNLQPQYEQQPNGNNNNKKNKEAINLKKNNSKLDAIFNKPSSTLTPIYICDNLVSDFIKYAQLNTSRDIETCGVLTGKYLHSSDSYLITHCIIPKQKGSANTVVTLHEEELIGIQEKYGVITLGWIHTHPSQTCFLSSVDMHCQLSYQIMMNNAIAIVYAPKDKTQTFTLTKKGISILSQCSCQGFHRHDGQTGLYQKANHVQIAKHQKCKFIDLRKK